MRGRLDCRTICRSYAAVRPLPCEAQLRWYTAAALLVERVLRPVGRLRTEIWPTLPAILADASRVWRGGCASG